MFVSHGGMKDGGSTCKFQKALRALWNLHMDPLSFIPKWKFSKACWKYEYNSHRVCIIRKKNRKMQKVVINSIDVFNIPFFSFHVLSSHLSLFPHTLYIICIACIFLEAKLLQFVLELSDPEGTNSKVYRRHRLIRSVLRISKFKGPEITID